MGNLSAMAILTLPHKQQALIDDADASLVAEYHWVTTGAGYVYALRHHGKKLNPTIYLHRLLTGATDADYVDHANRNTFDCRRSNLRKCSQSQNMANSSLINTGRKRSKFKGVKMVMGIYPTAQIMVNRKCIYLGSFKTERDAAQAYDKKAEEAWGEFALTNKKLGLL